MKSRAEKHNHSIEAEVRQILTEPIRPRTSNLADLISCESKAEIDFEPNRLGLAFEYLNYEVSSGGRRDFRAAAIDIENLYASGLTIAGIERGVRSKDM